MAQRLGLVLSKLEKGGGGNLQLGKTTWKIQELQLTRTFFS